MAKNPTFGSGVLFRNKGKLDKLNFEAARSPKAYDNAPDLTGKLGFTKAEANALMQYLKRAFENANEDSYGKVSIGFAATIRTSAKAGEYLSAWCSEPYEKPRPELSPSPADKIPDLDNEIPF
jgi:hypothetical protein